MRTTIMLVGLLVAMSPICSPVAGGHGMQSAPVDAPRLGPEDDQREQLADRVVAVLRRSGDWGAMERPLLDSIRAGIVSAPITVADGAIDSVSDRLRLLCVVPDETMPGVHDHHEFFGPLRRAIANGADDDEVRGYGTRIAGRIAAAATVRPLSPAREQEMRDIADRVIDLAYDYLKSKVLESKSGSEYLPAVDVWREDVHRAWFPMLGTPLIPIYGQLDPDLPTKEDGQRTFEDLEPLDMTFLVANIVPWQLDIQAESQRRDPDLPQSRRPDEVMGCLWSVAQALNGTIRGIIEAQFLNSPLTAEAYGVRRFFARKGGNQIAEARERRMDAAIRSDPAVRAKREIQEERQRKREIEPDAFGLYGSVEHLMRSGGFQWLDGIVVVPAEPGTPLDEDEPVIRP